MIGPLAIGDTGRPQDGIPGQIEPASETSSDPVLGDMGDTGPGDLRRGLVGHLDADQC